MNAIVLRPTALALGLAAALAACSPTAQDAGDDASDPAAAVVPADPGRGVMLAARADAVQAEIERRRTDGRLAPETADRMNAALVAIRGDLSAALSNSTGPLSRADRLALSDRLGALEAELSAPPPSAP